LAEARILGEGGSNAAGADDDDAPVAFEAQDVAEAGDEFGDGVAEAAFAEGAEEREVFADLGGGGAAELSEGAAGDRGQAAFAGLFEESEVEGEPTDGRVGDVLGGGANHRDAGALVKVFTS
jgi:hypothetical protein